MAQKRRLKMLRSISTTTVRNASPEVQTTADIRAKILEVWKRVDARKISIAEARLQIGLARTVLETLKVEIAAAHLSQMQLMSVPVAAIAPPKPVARYPRLQS